MKSFRKLFSRHRTVFLVGLTILTGICSYLSDPDQGWSTALGFLALFQGIWAVAAAHWTRKALMDYFEADQRNLFKKASEEPTGAGLALIALAIVFVGLLMVFAPRAHAAELPKGFYTYGPTLKKEQMQHWAAHPQPALLAALIEQESCISLKHSKCWNPGAKLKSAREEGAGFGQITRAYRADGSVRFDALESMKSQYKNELGEWSWSNVYQRPDLQLRAIVLMSKDTANMFRSAPAFLEFGDAAYNGGPGGVKKERRACQLTKGCDAGQWFGHVEHHCLKSRQPLYGNRNACDINREHVDSVFKIRLKRYAQPYASL